MENLTATGMAGKVLKNVRPLFYLELPSTSSFQYLADVPDYLKEVAKVNEQFSMHPIRNSRHCR